MDIKVTGLDKLRKDLDRMARTANPQQMASRMRGSRCPVHGQSPSNVRVVGKEVTAEFCCVRARERAVRDMTDSIAAVWR